MLEFFFGVWCWTSRAGLRQRDADDDGHAQEGRSLGAQLGAVRIASGRATGRATAGRWAYHASLQEVKGFVTGDGPIDRHR